MIENSNESKTPRSGADFSNIRKYKGVASVNVVAVNPDNAKLRSFGWDIAQDADEPKYVVEFERDGKKTKSARVRLLVQIQDLEDKPVIALDFWLRPEAQITKDGKKCKIIDSYCRSAWATKAEFTNHTIPQYENGPATISSDYKACHPGQEELVAFIHKYLNVTPLQVFSRDKNSWIPSAAPGKLTIDNWNALCSGDAKELIEYISLQPKNCVKVILGIRTTEDNKTYQTFMTGGLRDGVYIGNGALPDKNTGEYASARRAIDKYLEGNSNPSTSFSAAPVSEWKETATEIQDNSDQFTDGVSSSYDDINDLPFD